MLYGLSKVVHFAFCSLPDCADLLHPLELSALHSTHEKLWSAIMQWIRLQHSSICIIAFALKQMNCTLVRFIFCEFHSSKYCCRFADNMPMNSLCKWIKKKKKTSSEDSYPICDSRNCMILPTRYRQCPPTALEWSWYMVCI